MEAIDSTLLYRWFMGLNLEDKVWEHSTLSANRHRLVVDVEITHASGTAEREAELKMLARHKRKRRQLTAGADKGYDCKAFVKGCRKLDIIPHVAAKA